MSQSGAKAAAAKKTAAAKKAVNEKVATAREFEWRGIAFTLPPKLPATLAFDIAELEANPGVTELLRFTGTLIGTDQLAKLRAKLAEDGDAFEDIDTIMSEFLGLVLSPYGLSLGE